MTWGVQGNGWKFVKPVEKACAFCGVVQLLHHNALACKGCRPEQARQQSRIHYHRNVDRARKQRREWSEHNLEAQMVSAAKHRALRSGLEFTITTADVMIPERCPYLGLILTKVFRKGEQDTSPSLDRIDNRSGYVPGNVEVISHRANRIKNNATPEEALLMAEGFLERFS